MVFTVWLGVTYASTCLVKWSWKTKTLVTLGDWFSSIVVSILVKSTCNRFKGVVATIGHKGALGEPPSYWRQCLQALITCLICLAIPGHQKCSCNKERVWSQPWCPASLWHPLRAAVQCAFGPWRATNPHSPLLGWSIGRGCLGGWWNFDNFSISSNPPRLTPVPQGVSSDQFSSKTPTIAEPLLVQGLLFGLQPSWWHASLLGLIQRQLIPLFLFVDHL